MKIEKGNLIILKEKGAAQKVQPLHSKLHSVDFISVADAFRGHGLSLLDSQARLWGLWLVLFPLESPPPSLQ